MAAIEAQATDEQRSPSAHREEPVPWPTPAELRQAAPVIRLLAEIWAIPEVQSIGLTLDEDVHVWVVLADDNQAVESRISEAERAYVNATPLHSFTLDVIPLRHLAQMALPPFDTVLER